MDSRRKEGDGTFTAASSQEVLSQRPSREEPAEGMWQQTPPGHVFCCIRKDERMKGRVVEPRCNRSGKDDRPDLCKRCSREKYLQRQRDTRGDEV